MFKRVFTLFFIIITLSFAAEKDFKKVYKNTLRFEGKRYIKNCIEESKYGISKCYCKDVKNLTEKKAFYIAYNKIYKANNVDKIKNEKVRMFIFDWVYNSAPRGAIKKIQKLVDVEVTGNMNSETISAINNFSDTDLLIHLLKETRLNYLKTLKHYKKYKDGWQYRVSNVV